MDLLQTVSILYLISIFIFGVCAAVLESKTSLKNGWIIIFSMIISGAITYIPAINFIGEEKINEMLYLPHLRTQSRA
jgi:fucose permease